MYNDTAHWYRYIDMTPQVEALFRFIERTIATELVEELAFLANYDLAKAAIREIVDMPDRQIDLFIRACLQEQRPAFRAKRASHFDFLADEEVARMEQAIQAAYGGEAGENLADSRSLSRKKTQIMMKYDPLKPPDPAQWLAMDEGTRIALVEQYHRRTDPHAESRGPRRNTAERDWRSFMAKQSSMKAVQAHPYRVALAGGWGDHNFVNFLADGYVVVVQIQPTVAFHNRCGICSSTRQILMQE